MLQEACINNVVILKAKAVREIVNEYVRRNNTCLPTRNLLPGIIYAPVLLITIKFR